MPSKRKLKIVNQLAVVKPCVTDDFSSISEPRESGWYCRECQKEVHDFSKLSADEIVKLYESSGGYLCASISRRADGSIVTKEPPSSSLVYGGMLLAGTALLASTALADEPPAPGLVAAEPPVAKPGLVAVVPPENPENAPIRGEIAPVGEAIVPPVDQHETCKDQQPVPAASPGVTPDPNSRELGRIEGPTRVLRGKVAAPRAPKK